jgi:predicted nucleic acid-binding protein
MLVFFDTNIHIALLRGTVSVSQLFSVSPGDIKMSPIVASELVRGVRGRSVAKIETLIEAFRSIEPTSWRDAWLQAGLLLPKVFPNHEQIGLSRLQNDCMIAITARDTGALLLSADGHFKSIAKHVPFTWRHERISQV